MCDIDLEPCVVWRETPRRARKEHVCSCCKGAIHPGETYLVHFSLYDGDTISNKMCKPCEEARAEFNDAHGGSGKCTPDYLPGLLEECIQNGDEESETKWRPMLEIIRARKAALPGRGS